MIHLVLDTNVFYKEGLASARMKVLKTLTDSEYVKIYVPDLVKREFISKRISEIESAITKSIKGLKDTDT